MKLEFDSKPRDESSSADIRCEQHSTIGIRDLVPTHTLIISINK